MGRERVVQPLSSRLQLRERRHLCAACVELAPARVNSDLDSRQQAITLRLIAAASGSMIASLRFHCACACMLQADGCKQRTERRRAAHATQPVCYQSAASPGIRLREAAVRMPTHMCLLGSVLTDHHVDQHHLCANTRSSSAAHVHKCRCNCERKVLCSQLSDTASCKTRPLPVSRPK